MKFTFSSIETWKPATSLQTLFHKEPCYDFDQIFSYLLQFLRTVRTQLFYKTFFVYACEIGEKRPNEVKLGNINMEVSP